MIITSKEQVNGTKKACRMPNYENKNITYIYFYSTLKSKRELYRDSKYLCIECPFLKCHVLFVYNIFSRCELMCVCFGIFLVSCELENFYDF